MKIFRFLLLILCIQGQIFGLSSMRLMQSPQGQTCLLIGESAADDSLDSLSLIINFFEQTKVSVPLDVVIGLQKLTSGASKVQRTTAVTEKLAVLANPITQRASVSYFWDVEWDEVRDFMQEVKADLFEYTTMFVTDRDLQQFYGLPERFVASKAPTKKSWTEVNNLYKSRASLIQARAARNKWYTFKEHEFRQHLMINFASLEVMARECSPDAEFRRVFEEQVLNPFRLAIASIEKVFKPLPKEDTIYEGFMKVFFDSADPVDALRLVAYWDKIFEKNTEFLFITGSILNRFYKIGKKPLCCIANENVITVLTRVLKEGFGWTLQQESVLILPVTPLTLIKNEDPFFEAKLLRAAGDLVRPLMTEACVVCSKTNDLKQCAACKLAKYCSRECQIDDRNRHKTVCKKVAVKIPD